MHNANHWHNESAACGSFLAAVIFQSKEYRDRWFFILDSHELGLLNSKPETFSKPKLEADY